MGMARRLKKAAFSGASKDQGINKAKLADLLGNDIKANQFPTQVDVGSQHAVVQYSFDPELQAAMEKLFRSYSPDYGAFVVMDVVTGRVLAMVSYSRGNHANENLALKATFPTASVFKVVTAAAAIADKNFSPDTLVSFNGRNHTLYRGNVLKTRITRWTHVITLKEAFAKSINTVFAKIGAFTVGPEELRRFANRFEFDRPIDSDMPIEEGHAKIPQDPDDAWGLAEAASGYTQNNTMSPMQGALIASAVANDGVMMEPYVIQSVYSADGTPLYSAEPAVESMAVDGTTAAEIRSLMRETVLRGTSRHSFRGFFRGPYSVLNVGGKTGSLTGMDPPGKYDWFVGFAEGGTHRIAVAALTIHKKYWRVKSSYLARKAIEHYFHGKVHGNVAYQ